MKTAKGGSGFGCNYAHIFWKTYHLFGKLSGVVDLKNCLLTLNFYKLIKSRFNPITNGNLNKEFYLKYIRWMIGYALSGCFRFFGLDQMGKLLLSNTGFYNP